MLAQLVCKPGIILLFIFFSLLPIRIQHPDVLERTRVGGAQGHCYTQYVPVPSLAEVMLTSQLEKIGKDDAEEAYRQKLLPILSVSRVSSRAMNIPLMLCAAGEE